MELPDWLSKIIVTFFGLAALYFAFSGLFDPEYVYSRYEKRLLEKIGNTGLSIVWFFAAIGCFWAVYHMNDGVNKKNKREK